MTAPQPTTADRPTLVLLGSDHPHFRAGQRIAAQATRGVLTQLAVYSVYAVTVDRPAGRVVITTAQEYLFVATIESYDRLMAMPGAQTIPAWWYTRHAPRQVPFGDVWLRLGGFEVR